MTVKDTLRNICNRIAPLYGAGEARAIASLILFHLKGWSSTDIIINEDREVSEYMEEKINDIIRRVLAHEPVQYILGTARFYGLDLTVNRHTLIPRHETEELVDMIVDRFRNTRDLRVLDIGTGSGAIAIALARNLPFSAVTALDFSADALKIARENVARLAPAVKCIQADIFTFEPESDQWDIIVSNPPYVDLSEKKDMEAQVTEFEPSEALFVPDENPLIFYSRIIEVASRALVPGGSLYFEINPRHAAELKKLLEENDFREVEIHKDISRKDRFISAKKYDS